VTPKPPTPETPPGLVRQLGLFDAAMILCGIVIGSGIFTSTGLMAGYLPSPGWIMLAWLGGGLLTLFGALTFAELGAAMPQAGGHYVYLKEAYGSLWGFLCGWILFLVYMSGGIAALAAAFAEYLGGLWPVVSTSRILWAVDILPGGSELFWRVSAGQLVAVTSILGLSWVNWLGVREGKLVQNSLTVIKICVLAILVVLGLTLGKGQGFAPDWQPAGLDSTNLVMGFGVALVAVSWAFDGWNNVNFAAGEILNPARTLPRALVLGTLLVTGLYLLVNLVYFRALSIGEMAGEVRVAELAVDSLFGGSAGSILAVAIIVSILGSLNGSILTGPRIYWAMARDGLFFKSAARVHPRNNTPDRAIVLQAVWASLLALTGTFSQLFTFVMFVSIMFWIAAAGAVIVLRKKKPDLARPYRVWGYPWVPLIFIGASLGILASSLIENPVASLAGIGLTLLGVPVYLVWKKDGGWTKRWK
jgi:basic amino acid/polyamine antiporter, APA family